MFKNAWIKNRLYVWENSKNIDKQGWQDSVLVKQIYVVDWQWLAARQKDKLIYGWITGKFVKRFYN